MSESSYMDALSKIPHGMSCPCQNPCPLKKALEIIGGKWKVRILCTLKVAEVSRYNEMLKKIDGITNTMLASSLKELERDGLVKRTIYDTMPVKVEYSLTEKTEKLIPILVSLGMWYAEVGSVEEALSSLEV